MNNYETHGQRLARYKASEDYIRQKFYKAKPNSKIEICLSTALTALVMAVKDQQRIVDAFGADTCEFIHKI